MLIIGCDFHTRYQQIAMLDDTTGEVVERRLDHLNGEAQAFYGSLRGPVRVGIEATGPIRWFQQLLAERGHELWVGHAAEIRARAIRRQKTDTRDARHLLELLRSNRFPRIWVPSPVERDMRQLLRHPFQLVSFRTSVKNQLHALALGQPSPQGIAGTSGSVESHHRGVGLGGEAGSAEPRRSPAFNAAAGCRAGDRAGLCAHHRAG